MLETSINNISESKTLDKQEKSNFSVWWKIKNILNIWDFTLGELRLNIQNELNFLGIKTYNELYVYWLNNFKKRFKHNLVIKYFILKLFNKSIANINWNHFYHLVTKIRLPKLNNQELNTKLKNYLKTKNFYTLEDFDKCNIQKFKTIINWSLFFKYYLKENDLIISDFDKNLILKTAQIFWFKNNDIDEKKYIKHFLIKKEIKSYNDLIKSDDKNWRSLLFNDEIIRGILKRFGLQNSQDYRLEHTERFARFAWLQGTPIESNKLSNIEIKNKMIHILKQDQIDCMFSLQISGVKSFIRKFKKQNVWPRLYDQFKKFIFDNIWVTISSIVLENLSQIWTLLELPKLTEQEHKEKLLLNLRIDNKKIEEISASQIKKRYWKNKHIRYFLLKITGITDIKKINTDIVIQMRKYIEWIK
jgi:hypothetical protein